MPTATAEPQATPAAAAAVKPTAPATVWIVDGGKAKASPQAGKSWNHSLRVDSGSATLVESETGAADEITLVDVTSIEIDGSDQDDVIAIDIATTSTVPMSVTFDGRAGSDTIVGPKSDATWSVTGADSGTVAGVTFTNVENLQGAAGNSDTFLFAPGGSVSGSVDGGAGGSDTIVLPEGTAFTVGAAQANGIWFRYAGVESISAGAPAGVAGGGSAAQAVAGAPLNAEAAARAAPDAPGAISAAGAADICATAVAASPAAVVESAGAEESAVVSTETAPPTTTLTLASTTSESTVTETATTTSGTLAVGTADVSTVSVTDAPEGAVAAAPADTSDGSQLADAAGATAASGGGNVQSATEGSSTGFETTSSDEGPTPESATLPSLDPAAIPGSGPSPPATSSDASSASAASVEEAPASDSTTGGASFSAAASSSPWTIFVGAQQPGAAQHLITLAVEGGDLVVTIDGVATSRPVGSVQSLTITGTDVADSLSLEDAVAALGILIAFNGGAGSDTIHGPAADSRWTIDGPGTGNVGALSFTGVESLAGAPNNKDTFVFAAAGTLAGTVDGGAGGYDTIEVAGGGASVRSSITGPQSGRIARGGDVITYAGMEPVTITGTTDVSLDAPNDATIVIEETGTASDKTFSVDFNGGGETNVITGADTITSLTINLGTGTNTVTIQALDTAFTGSVTINGGTGDDTVNFVAKSSAGTYTFSGGAGTDTIVATRDANMFLSDSQLTVGSDVIHLSSVEAANLTAGAGANIFTIGSFTGSAILDGREGNDTYVFGAAAKGSSFLDETDGGVDTIDLSARSGVTINLATTDEQSVDADLKLDALVRQRLRERRRDAGRRHDHGQRGEQRHHPRSRQRRARR